MVQYKMTVRVKRYYRKWIDSSHPLFCSNDVAKFYRFAKACARHGGVRHWNGHRLRYFLERDLPQKYSDPEYVEQQIRQAVSIFDHLMGYERTGWYDHDIEDPLRNFLATAANSSSNDARSFGKSTLMPAKR